MVDRTIREIPKEAITKKEDQTLPPLREGPLGIPPPPPTEKGDVPLPPPTKENEEATLVPPPIIEKEVLTMEQGEGHKGQQVEIP